MVWDCAPDTVVAISYAEVGIGANNTMTRAQQRATIAAAATHAPAPSSVSSVEGLVAAAADVYATAYVSYIAPRIESHRPDHNRALHDRLTHATASDLGL
jgi:hypothetical protein